MQRETYTNALDHHRDYLRLLARLHIGDHLRAKLDPSDLVQQTMLEAYRKKAEFRGSSTAEFAAWLRQVLAYCLSDAAKNLGRAKRDVFRERSLQTALDASSAQLQAWLADDRSSPSVKAQRDEHAVYLAKALARLPEGQREAVIMRHLQGLSLDAVAQKLGCTERAVSGLLQRGLRQLRLLLEEKRRDE